MVEHILSFIREQFDNIGFLPYLLAAFIGGLVSVLFKFLGETFLVEKYKHQRKAKEVVEQFKNPIIQSADELKGRIVNLLDNYQEEWLKESDYYKASTFYVFCRYFAWIEILFLNLQKLCHFTSPHKNRKLYQTIINANKAFNNQKYFGFQDSDDQKNDNLPKYVCKALGELVITLDDDGKYTCMSFIDFWDRYKNDLKFAEWLTYLDEFLTGVRPEYGNVKWDRLLLIELSLIAITSLLDPKNEQSRAYSPELLRRILSDIRISNAREVFCADIAYNKIPLKVESFWNRRKRRWKILWGERGELTEHHRFGYFYHDFWTIHFPCDLEKPEKRNEMYQEIIAEAKEKTDQLEGYHHITVILHVKESEENCEEEIMQRIPNNIYNLTQGRVRHENVRWRYESDIRQEDKEKK